MELIITLLVSLVIFALVLGLLLKVKTPRYRVDVDDVRQLLEQMLCGQAHPHDWQVFVGYQIRDNPDLERIRVACQKLDETEFRANRRGGYLLTNQGLEALETLIQEL